MAGVKKNSILHRIGAATDFQSSTKIEALREELTNMLARDPAAKAIVFSQFTSMLDLIFFRLTQVSTYCVSLGYSRRHNEAGHILRRMPGAGKLHLC
jgi:DNA repair protein RAD16